MIFWSVKLQLCVGWERLVTFNVFYHQFCGWKPNLILQLNPKLNGSIELRRGLAAISGWMGIELELLHNRLYSVAAQALPAAAGR